VVLEFFKGSSQSPIEEVQATLVRMLEDGHDIFVTASDALFGGGKSKATKREVRSTDQEINEMQADVRRSLMIHASVNPGDLPLVLQYASIVKDAERVGDYAKNLYDLVRYGANFANAPDEDELFGYRNNVASLILEAASVFEAMDTVRAQELIDKADGFLSNYDDHVKALCQVPPDTDAQYAVSRALYYRFLKRTTAHIMNVLTSLVQPLDRLDYYDEAPEDR
jgi:phosphate transport system protein